MKTYIEYISSQFKNPQGFAGTIVGIIQNTVNRAMYSAAVCMVDFGPDEKILDIGYGNGHLLKSCIKSSPWICSALIFPVMQKKWQGRKI